MKGRVLIIDDDDALRRVIAQGLTSCGYETVAVASAEVALVHLDGEEFDAVLADLQLDGMDGIELCQRSHELQPNLPVIVITGYGRYETAVAAIRAGAYDFLSKPLDMEVVTAAVGPRGGEAPAVPGSQAAPRPGRSRSWIRRIRWRQPGHEASLWLGVSRGRLRCDGAHHPARAVPERSWSRGHSIVGAVGRVGRLSR